MALIRVVGLGPAGLDLVTTKTWALLKSESLTKRSRTNRHPALDEAAASGVVLTSYDALYDRADSFEELYQEIVDDLVALAKANGEVLYVVPGSPTVAERTVELLQAQSDVPVVIEPAVSVIDVTCGALHIDPMAVELRIVDALATAEPFRGPGPLLVLQTYAPEILASVADRLPVNSQVTVLHHLGLSDERVERIDVGTLSSFPADHLTSLYVDDLRTAGEAMDDLVDFMHRLRAECPWDQEQTHASLVRHMLEETYEAMDALDALVYEDEHGEASDEVISHAEEELGDLLFQVLFHAELASEEDRFTMATIMDATRDKLTYRHPHVFGDVVATDANDVASRWEELKKKEKGRTSVLDGIAWQLPSLSLYAKLLRKADSVGLSRQSGEESRLRTIALLEALNLPTSAASDVDDQGIETSPWMEILSALVETARFAGIDLESVLRSKALQLRDEILAIETKSN